MDQPIYAIGKQIQWKWKEDLGEDKYVLMLGALHIEGSGFSYIISEAGVLTSGRSEAVSSPAPDHQPKRTRYVHQVFLLAGSILKLEAFEAQSSISRSMSERELGCCNEDVIQAVGVLVFGDGSGDAAMPLCSLSKRR